jgi:tetratricopeptide (TPR) repeat protein
MTVQQPCVRLAVEGVGALDVSLVDGAVAGLDEVLARSNPGTLSQVCKMLEKVGEVLEGAENYLAAARVYGHCVHAAEGLKSPLNAALALNNQALAYKRANELERALEVYERAVSLIREPLSLPAEERERPAVMLPLLLNIAMLHYQRGEHLEAADAATSALQLARTRTDEASRRVVQESTSLLGKLGL